ncbi:MAG: valine--tRNA ligase [Alphaproteobacteria bacterium]
MLEKTFSPAEIEPRHYAREEAAGAFACGRAGSGAPYTIVIPPPNVTGTLHMGHALNNTLQDVLVRWRRMQGRDVLWQPGMDHAGIATQMVVERQLAEEGGNMDRRSMGREAFVERVWEWKAESGGMIINQLRRLGASCDWSRERFTMDEGLSRAVLKVFVQLYRQGLIYKDKRLVNWDPKLETAISDLEVEQVETRGHMWHFRYPVEGGEGAYLVVATTRPETMLGDTGVAVHPDDERYRHLVGRHCILPLVGRRIPIVADPYADPEQGTGAVKMTPAHDFNDFEVGRRHGLEMINIFDIKARLNDEVPEKYRGMDRFEARKAVVADLEALGLLDRIEDHVHTVPYGDRGGVPIEPYLTEQWYVDAATLAKPAIAAVEDGRTRFVPEQWARTYFDWMRNIQPWCVSRQLWWGHRIPAWYGPDGRYFVAETEADAQAEADVHYGAPTTLSRDPDVLDTWFSSALWPFSTLGWPDETAELKRHYQTDVLVTGFDIIFFWVARMMMMGLHFMPEAPFHTVYIHGIVRDEQGRKMSKSKGNVVDPMALIEEFGADALRFTMAALATPGRDVKPAKARIAGYRNFATKLWNAARFTEMNGCRPDPAFDPAQASLPVNRWIVGETVRCTAAVTAALEEFKFDQAAGAVYQFVWHSFCDWYLEFTKPILQDAGADLAEAAETRATTAWALGRILHLLHPFMPFVTEELWEKLGPAEAGLLVTAPWPDAPLDLVDVEAADTLNWVVELVSAIRTVRAELNVPPSAELHAQLYGTDAAALARVAANDALVRRVARLASITASAETAGEAATRGAAQAVVGTVTVVLPLGGVVDLAQEKARLAKDMAKFDAEVAKIEAKLSNPQFLSRAPEEVVLEQRSRQAEAADQRARLAAALARLGS